MRDPGPLQKKSAILTWAAGDALLGGLLEPFGGLAEFLRDAVAARAEARETELRLGIAGFRSDTIPFRRLDHVWHRRLAAFV